MLEGGICSSAGAINGCPTQFQDGSSPVSIDPAHWPDLPYIPYILTGGWYYLNQQDAQAVYAYVSDNPGYYAWNNNRMILDLGENQVRAYAWGLRQVVEAAYSDPNNDPLKSFFVHNAALEFQYLYDQYINSSYVDTSSTYTYPNYFKEGQPHGYIVGTAFAAYNCVINACVQAPWQQDYFASTVISAAEMGIPGALTYMKWMTNFISGRFTAASQGFNPMAGVTYELPVMNVTTTAFQPLQTWASVWNADIADGSIGTSTYNGYQTYENLVNYEQLAAGMSAAIYAVDGNATALQAYNWLMSTYPTISSAYNRSYFGDQPQDFAISGFNQSLSLSAGSIYPSSPIIDSGQSVILEATASGGVYPYAYQWYSGASCISAISGATGSTYSISPTSASSYSYKVTDSSGTSQCSPVDNVTVNTAFSPGSVSASASALNPGQSVTFTANPSGGTVPYSYKWYSETGANPLCSPSYLVPGQTSSTYTATPDATNTFDYQVTDSATVPDSQCSASSATVTVTTMPIVTLSTNASGTTIGSNIMITSHISSGTGPFTVNLIYNGSVVSTNTISTPGGSAMLFFFPNTTGSYSFKADAIDNGNSGFAFNSTVLNTVVNPIQLYGENSSYSINVSSKLIPEFNYLYSGTILKLIPMFTGSILENIDVSNLNSDSFYTSIPAPAAHGIKVLILNISGANTQNSEFNYNITIPYPCGEASPAPYILQSGNWMSVSSFIKNTTSCTLKFNVTADPVVGVFANDTPISLSISQNPKVLWLFYILNLLLGTSN